MPSRSGLARLFDANKVTVNGRPVKPAYKPRPGDSVEVDVPPPKKLDLSPEDLELTVIHQDRDLIVVDKPAGMMTHPTPSTTTGTLVNALLARCEDLSGVGGEIKPGIVHRLDKLTSGVMAAAKNDRAHLALAEQFKAHSIERKYVCLAHGTMKKDSGRIETLIGRNVKHRLKMTADVSRGRVAVTNFRVLARARGVSLVECELETGRTHQIRVHLSENNHPLVGDPLYGKGRQPPAGLDENARAAVRQLKRQALHAWFLAFDHPGSGERMAFASPPPADIRAAVSALGMDFSGLDIPEAPARLY